MTTSDLNSCLSFLNSVALPCIVCHVWSTDRSSNLLKSKIIHFTAFIVALIISFYLLAFVFLSSFKLTIIQLLWYSGWFVRNNNPYLFWIKKSSNLLVISFDKYVMFRLNVNVFIFGFLLKKKQRRRILELQIFVWYILRTMYELKDAFFPFFYATLLWETIFCYFTC